MIAFVHSTTTRENVKRGNLWIHLPLDTFSFSLVTSGASRPTQSLSIPPIAIKRCAHFGSDLIRIAHIENVICSRDCGPMWVRTFTRNYVIFSCQLHFDGSQQRARHRNNSFFIILLRTEHKTKKREKWKMMIFVFEMLVVCRFVVVRLFHRECVSSGSGVDAATPVWHHEYFNFNFTSGFPVSTTPFVIHPTEFSIFPFLFVSMHTAHCMRMNEVFFFTRNVMSQCAYVWSLDVWSVVHYLIQCEFDE